jgi:hypothetical protein
MIHRLRGDVSVRIVVSILFAASVICWCTGSLHCTAGLVEIQTLRRIEELHQNSVATGQGIIEATIIVAHFYTSLSGTAVQSGLQY